MVKIDKIEMPEAEAKKLWQDYNKVLKKRKEKYLEELKKCYHQLSKGKKLIDIYAVMKKVGVSREGVPRLAIARADWKEVVFSKRDTGTGVFSDIQKNTWDDELKDEVGLPSEIFPNWSRAIINGKDSTNIFRRYIKSGVPLIPANLLPDGSLDKYYILWEVKNWEDFLPPARDPILLKRISNNLFAILGAWDVTPLERSIIAGKK